MTRARLISVAGIALIICGVAFKNAYIPLMGLVVFLVGMAFTKYYYKKDEFID